MIPIELFGRMRFPEITEAPYFISLGPHDFYWLALERAAGAEVAAERPTLAARGALDRAARARAAARSSRAR